MNLTRRELEELAGDTGFRAEILEKVVRLLNLLEAFHEHPYLQDRFVVKGGAALNAFLFRLPRLSGDLDLNYVGQRDVDRMKEERPDFERAVRQVCASEGLRVVDVPDEHLGGTWRLRYDSTLGGESNLELDINYGYRVPLWSPSRLDSIEIGEHGVEGIPVLDIHELAAGKLVALVARDAPRDVFDVCELFGGHEFDTERLRAAFVAYGAMTRQDWREISVDDVSFRSETLKNELLPYLRKSEENEFTMGDCREMVTECRTILGRLLPFEPEEKEFLDRLLEQGEIKPDLLTDDSQFANRIGDQPLLEWKAQNVREHSG